MQEAHSNKNPNDFDNQIDLRELFYVLLDGKWIIVSLTAFVSIIGVIYSLLLPNIYESRAILVPVNSSSGISGALRSYSGLAGLAGINLPSDGNEGNSAEAVKKISSLSFFENKTHSRGIVVGSSSAAGIFSGFFLLLLDNVNASFATAKSGCLTFGGDLNRHVWLRWGVACHWRRRVSCFRFGKGCRLRCSFLCPRRCSNQTKSAAGRE